MSFNKNLKRKTIIFSFIYLFLLFLLNQGIFSQTQSSIDVSELSLKSLSKGIYITNPQNGTIYPPEFACPTFQWEDSSKNVDWWVVAVTDSKNTRLANQITNTNSWKPARELWEKLKKNGMKDEITVSIYGMLKSFDKPVSSSIVKFRTSKDSVGAPIFFREVPLPFSFILRHLEMLRWRLGYVSSDSGAKVVMEKLPVCANCHSFSADGSTIGMDLDAHSDKDAYGIAQIEKNIVLHRMIRWSQFQNNEKTYAILTNISPNGRYLASTLRDNEFFVVQPDTAYSQLFFPIKGIIAIYDKETDKYFALPGADDTNYVQSNATWSADGKFLYYCKAKAIPSHESGFITSFDRDSIKYQKLVDDFYYGRRNHKFDLYKIPFNEGKGGEPVPVPGASNNDMSNYFPKASPDGKWLVYCQAKNFMLLQPDSRLYIVQADLSTLPRKLDCNSDNKMNSWHSWSPNSRWLVFSSKRRGPFTNLYLSHIDENGQDSPAIWLENFSYPGKACNLPEFVNIGNNPFNSIKPKFLESDYFAFQDGVRKVQEGDFAGAIIDFNKAAALDSNNFMVFGSRGYTYLEMKKYDSAIIDLTQAIHLKHNEAKLYNMRGFAYLDIGKKAEAIEDFKSAVLFNPKDFESYNALGYIMVQDGKNELAIDYLNRALKLQKDYPEALYERGTAKYNIKDFEGALSDFSKAVKIKPDFAVAYYYRAMVFLAINDKRQACYDLNRAYTAGYNEAYPEIEKYCKDLKGK
ncbi:MAG: hypothetical protein HW421_1332 [Ignavibacteria bacterium]|nr:hypothetical protein [Ignavibacteria bacterium]